MPGTMRSHMRVPGLVRVIATLAALLAVSGCAGQSTLATAATGHCPAMSFSNNSDRLHALLLDARSPHVMVAAHRACWRGQPENSLAAIEACIDAGVDIVELDVQRTRDGHLVLQHDRTLDRMTDGAGRVEDNDLAAIRSLHLRQGAGGPRAELTDQRIPTLAEALAITRGRILVNIDVKDSSLDDAMAVVRRMGLEKNVLAKAVIKPQDIAGLRARIGTVPFMPILWEKDSDQPLSQRIAPYLTTAPVAFEIVYDSPGYLAEGARAMRAAAVRAWSNTMLPRYSAGLADEQASADPAGVWGVLVDQGVTMIQTDWPIKAIDYLKTRKLRCPAHD